MNLISGETQKFAEFSQFANLNEFNRHMEMWLSVHKDDFTKGELVGLKRLVRFSAKIPGVSNAKIGTILKAIHDEFQGNGISRSTFKRMIGKAAELGIFSVHETARQKNGSQSSNLYVFNRFPSSEPPEQEIMDHPNETSNLLKTEKEQKIKKRNEQSAEVIHNLKKNETRQRPQLLELDHTYVSNRVPQPFVQLVKYFFSDAKTIEAFWQRVQIAAHCNNSETETERMLEVAMESFKQLIRKLKTNTVEDRFAYFYGILHKKFFQRYYESLFEEYGTPDQSEDTYS